MAVKKVQVAKEPEALPRKGRASERVQAGNARLDAMAALIKRIGDSRPASEVLREERVVPTIFPIFDHEIGVGGLPVGRVILVHGPSAEGKSPFGIGLGRSFLERGHFFDFVDAERTMTAEWTRSLLGEYFESGAFTAPSKIGMYEDVRAHVRRWAETIAEARGKQIPEDTTGVVVIDSINKLVPEALWKELSKVTGAAGTEDNSKSWRKGKQKPGIDGMGGRAGQIMAGFNAAWMNEVVPLMADTQTTMVIIARESVEKGEGFFADDVINVKGGRAIKYDSSLWLRIVDSPTWQKVGDEKAVLVGRKHTIEIRRSKVGARKEKIPEAAYHTSNGVASPEGFDRVRDVFELSCDMGVMDQAGAYYKFEGESVGQGEQKALEALRSSPDLCFKIEEACRAKF